MIVFEFYTVHSHCCFFLFLTPELCSGRLSRYCTLTVDLSIASFIEYAHAAPWINEL